MLWSEEGSAKIQRLSEIAMTLFVRQRAPRHKQRTVVTETDPVQVVLMIVAALAVTTLVALDFFFS